MAADVDAGADAPRRAGGTRGRSRAVRCPGRSAGRARMSRNSPNIDGGGREHHQEARRPRPDRRAARAAAAAASARSSRRRTRRARRARRRRAAASASKPSRLPQPARARTRSPPGCRRDEAPAKSRPRHCARRRSAAITLTAATASTRPTGRLMTKMRRQSTIRSARRRTDADGCAGTADGAPAAERLGPSDPWNELVTIDSAAGDSIAAPGPARRERRTACRALPASAEPSEARTKTPRPVRNMRRRPSRSAARPPSSSRLPKTSE